MQRRPASNLVSGAAGGMILRRWRNIAPDTAAVFVFRAGHKRVTSERKNWGDLHIRRSRERDHNPTGTTGTSGVKRKTKSFSSAGGRGICSSLLRLGLIAVSARRPLRSFLCRSSKALSGGIGAFPSTSPDLILSDDAADSRSASEFVVANRRRERASNRVPSVNRACAVAAVSLKSDMAATLA